MESEVEERRNAGCGMGERELMGQGGEQQVEGRETFCEEGSEEEW